MFKRIISWIRQVIGMVLPGMQRNGSGSNINTAVSTEMSNAVELWMNLYIGQAPWLSQNRQSMGLPASIASEMARMVTLEMQVKIEGSSRADYLNKQFEPVRDSIRLYCEYGCASGGLMLKPYVDNNNNVAVDIVQATDFYPLSFNSSGKLMSCMFVEHKLIGNKYYHRIEKHEFVDGIYIITNKVYESTTSTDIGKEVPLISVPEWAMLQPEQPIKGISSPLFSYFRIPLGNTIDPSSPLGVSVYARAINLIEDADRQYQRLMWEFEGGELAIDASQDVFKLDDKGRPILPLGKERLFRPNELVDNKNSSELMKTFSPTLRDASIKSGLNTILQKIEFNTGLAYGTLSDPQSVDKTATEITTSKQRTYSNVTDIQKSLQAALENLLYAMDVYTTLYKLAPAGPYTTAFEWDDSVIVDAETERMRDLQEVKSGLLPKWRYISKWRGLEEADAKAEVDEMNSASDTNLFN